ncbi:hypothetical protein C8R44DRAFT_763158 [Mycena epipterygia]|nr:hypothetical protein C8R44DRAFT_763158 [Mycena epipterygia]
MVLNVESWAEKPLSNSFNAYLRLVRDARFHSTHLLDVEGRVAPQHYGLWMMDTGAWAGKVLFSITQWCGRTWAELSQSNLNTEANRCLSVLLPPHSHYLSQAPHRPCLRNPPRPRRLL